MSISYDPSRIAENLTEGATVAVIGASGGIGSAMVQHLADCDRVAKVLAYSRSGEVPQHEKVVAATLDVTDEATIGAAAEHAKAQAGDNLQMVIVAVGVLHDGEMQPEKAAKELDADTMQRNIAINTMGPALVGKHFLPLLPRNGTSVFAALTARVGSISDNHMGGWYSYRASKAAAHMILKNFAIEYGRTRKEMAIVGLQPGTVDTQLSKPFQGHVKEGHLYAPEDSAGALLAVLGGLSAADSGKLFDYNGESFAP